MSAVKPLNFFQEEESMYETFNRAAAAFYKFFNLIYVEIGDGDEATVSFGNSYEDDEVPVEVAKQIRSFVKAQMRKIRENPLGYDASEGRRKLFWLITIFEEYGIFSPAYQSKIMMYAQLVLNESKEDE